MVTKCGGDVTKNVSVTSQYGGGQETFENHWGGCVGTCHHYLRPILSTGLTSSLLALALSLAHHGKSGVIALNRVLTSAASVVPWTTLKVRTCTNKSCVIQAGPI